LKAPGEPGVFCLKVKEKWGKWQGKISMFDFTILFLLKELLRFKV
jgi:hypothetical protein